MAEPSRTHITITLGRTGQVVKRAGAEPVSAKRSLRDRLGTTVDAPHHHNKRSRRDDATWNFQANDDVHLTKDDLRFQIMKRTGDLRDMLSRPSTTKPVASQSLHEPRHGRHMPERRRIPEPRNIPEPRDPRHMPEQRYERHHMLDQREDRRPIPESRDDRRRMAEVRQHIPKLNDTRQHIPEHFTSMRTSEGPSQMDFLRNSYSPWTLDHIRRKSPDLNTSRSLSPPPRRMEETQRRPVTGAYEAPPKSVTYGSRDVSEIPRPMTTTSFMTKPSLSVGPLVTLPSGGSMQRTQYPVAENLTVERFLRSLGLEKYLISFKVEEVDMAALSQMGDRDFKEMGIPMGPRKKIILALLARARGQGR